MADNSSAAPSNFDALTADEQESFREYVGSRYPTLSGAKWSNADAESFYEFPADRREWGIYVDADTSSAAGTQKDGQSSGGPPQSGAGHAVTAATTGTTGPENK